MSDTPENLVLTLLRRLDGKVDRLLDDVQDMKRPITSAQRQTGELRVDLAGISARLYRIELGVERIEQRLDLVGS